MNTRCAFFVLVTLIPTLSLAQVDTPRVDQRQLNQERRIEQGVASGSLTVREANRLERGQQHVSNIETRAKTDGVVTSQELARLDHAQDVQSRRITRQVNDRQHDYNHNGRIDRPARR